MEQFPPLMMMRPFIAEADPPTGHPGLAVLKQAGVLDAEEAVHPQVRTWVEALGSPDVALCGDVARGASRLLFTIAKRGPVTVAMTRHEDDVVIENIGAVGSMRELAARILPVAGPPVAAAQFKPVMVPTADFMDGCAQIVGGEHSAAVVLSRLGLDADQRRVVTAAADRPLMTMSLLVMRAGRAKQDIGIASVAVIDTDAGRVVSGPVRSDNGAWWTMMAPGTVEAAGRALEALLGTVGVASWSEYRRAD
ncbi:ESX secretion-associated protein EspG [Mycobacterium sp. M1]|uniref:ESX secretion-associated protein EspG n=1 Tax=Mycolicibacter acidiphilus TaxID=2835306 RepID=A0ABS5RQY5_9MYCO|nr:ESX secretion-associated protein EspG [Mycolicibacter acidiphilus]